MLRDTADSALVLRRSKGEAVRVRFPDPARHLFQLRRVDPVRRTRVENDPQREDDEVLRSILGDGLPVPAGETARFRRRITHQHPDRRESPEAFEPVRPQARVSVTSMLPRVAFE